MTKNLNMTSVLQFQEKSKLSARITSEVFRLLAEAFNADEYEEANSLRFQAKSLSTAGGIILKQVEDNQVEIPIILTYIPFYHMFLVKLQQ